MYPQILLRRLKSERLEVLEQGLLLVVGEHVGQVVAGGALPGATRVEIPPPLRRPQPALGRSFRLSARSVVATSG